MGAPSYGRRMAVVRAAADAARAAQRKADELACRAWNVRMKEEGGPAQPSPSLRAALNGGYRFLRVQCSGCKQRAYIDLEQVKRRAGTAGPSKAHSLARHAGIALAVRRARLWSF